MALCARKMQNKQWVSVSSVNGTDTTMKRRAALQSVQEDVTVPVSNSVFAHLYLRRIVALASVIFGAVIILGSPAIVAKSTVVGGETITSPSTKKQSEQIVLRPHRAVYDISLARSSTGSTIASLEGRMVYDLSGNPCDGYTQTLRFVTRTTNQNGDAQFNDLRTTSWESDDSKTLRFDVQNFQGEDLAEASKGVAERAASEDNIRITLKKPRSKERTISGQILFPIAHSKALLEAARAGQTIFPASFYDGSETGEKVYQTSAVIGKPVAAVRLAATEKKPTPLELANTVISWPVAMSYYDTGDHNPDGRPSFEMSYRFHLNGVTSKFLIDHGDFAFNGLLRKLVFTAPAGCKTEATTSP